MEPQFWHNRWRNGQIGFHQSSVDRSLRRHWPELNLGRRSRRGSRVFVPLVRQEPRSALAARSGPLRHRASSSPPRPLEAFCMENGIPARRRMQADFDVYEAGNLQLYRGDFFRLTPAILGETAAVYDRAALISWAPELRSAYVDHIAALVRPRTADAADHAGVSAGADAGTAVLRGRATRWSGFIRATSRSGSSPGRTSWRARRGFDRSASPALSEVCYQLVRQ